jgi:pantetheine-phosphate adenylyltransferase
MKVCVGGTFNILHKGHKYLIEKAFQIAGKNGIVFFGVSEGETLHKRKKFVNPFNKRLNNLKKYLKLKNYEKRSIIVPIHDKYGLTLDKDFDAIIVSPGTIKNAIEINKERKKIGKKPIKIIKIPYVLADDNKPISSTRIYDKIINENGKVKN